MSKYHIDTTARGGMELYLFFILFLLVNHKNGTIKTSMEKLMDHSNMTKAYVDRCLRNLYEWGYIILEPLTKGMMKIYLVHYIVHKKQNPQQG